MIGNKTKSALAVILAAVFIAGCSLFDTVDDKSASLTFRVTGEMAAKIAGEARSARSANESGSDTGGLFFDIALKGDYEAAQTIALKEGAAATFSDIPVDCVVWAEAVAYKIESDDKDGGKEDRTELYTGTSEKITIQEGVNTLSLEMKKSAFTVTFDTNGGTAVAQQLVTKGEKASEPTAPTREGYTFAGWYSDSDLTSAFSFDTAITASITLYAKWTEKAITPDSPTYTVTVADGIANGTVAADKTSAKAGETVTLTVTASDGYKVSTISVTDTGGNAVAVTDNAFTMPESNVTVSATFEETADTVNQKAAAAVIAKITAIGTVAYTSESKAKIDEACAAYDALTEAQKALVPTETLALLTSAESKYSELKAAAEQQSVTYTVTFETNGGSEIEAQTVTSGEKATEPTAPTREGYTFAGWYSDSDLTSAFSFDTAITADTKLYAKWTEDPLSVATAEIHIEINYGDGTYVTQLNFTKDGDTFTYTTGEMFADGGATLVKEGDTLTLHVVPMKDDADDEYNLVVDTASNTYTVDNDSTYDEKITLKSWQINGTDIAGSWTKDTSNGF